MKVKRHSKILSMLLAVAMVLSLLPVSALAADNNAYSDTTAHWAASAIDKWSIHGVLTGADGAFRPDAPITRAELAAVIDRVMKYQAASSESFSDVASTDWYVANVLHLNAAGVMLGADGKMRPNDPVTREEAAVMFARAFSVEENAGNENAFPDAAQISGWASFFVDGMHAKGYINGKPGGNFDPKATITRAEVVTILDNMIVVYISVPGEHDCELVGTVEGNALVNAPGAIVKNLEVTGDLYLTAGIGAGDVTLENCNIMGRTIISGGGANSVNVVGSNLGQVLFQTGFNTSLKMDKASTVREIRMKTSGSVTHNGVTVTYDAATGKMTFGGAIDKAVLNTDGTTTVTIGGIAYNIIPPASGKVTSFALAAGTIVKEMVLSAPADITGAGKVDKLAVNASGSTIASGIAEPKNVTAPTGTTLTIGSASYTGAGADKPVAQVTATTSGGGGSNGSGGSGGSRSSGGNGGSSDPTTPTNPTDPTDPTTPTTYTVTFDTKGGSAVSPVGSLASGATLGSGMPAAPSKTDRSFMGWNTAADGSGTAFTAATQVTASLTVYAMWAGENTYYPIEVNNAAGLAAIGASADALTLHYGLTASLDLSGSAWTPIGSYEYSHPAISFTGSFDGNGKTLTLGAITRDANGFAGLFGGIGAGGHVHDLMVDGAITPTGTEAVTIGGVTGFNSGLIERCTVAADVTANGVNSGSAGGIAGGQSGLGIISGCHVSGAVSITATANNIAAGGITSGRGTVTGCSATGAVSADAPGYIVYAGGISGSDSNISNCFSTGDVSADGGMAYAGGIVGVAFSRTITNCYTTGTVASTGTFDSNAGGIVGTTGSYVTTAISNCAALNASVSAWGAASNREIGRVLGNIGTDATPTLAGNFGFVMMLGTSSATGKDGEDITEAAAQTRSTYETDLGWAFGSSADAPWKWDSVLQRPVL